MTFRLATLLPFLIGLSVLFAQQGNVLTNNDVIRMVREKVDESVIMRAIRTSDTDFDISPNGLIQLKKGKVKKRIVEAIQEVQLRRNNARGRSNNGLSRTPGQSSVLSPTSTPTPSPSPKVLPIATEHSAFYRFDLQKCSQSGLSVLCKFTITNLGDFRHLWVLLRDSNIIDNNGNKSRANDIRLGVKRDDEADLPEGISIECSLTFEGVPTTASRISRLTVAFYPGNRASRTEVLFKDIPLSR